MKKYFSYCGLFLFLSLKSSLSLSAFNVLEGVVSTGSARRMVCPCLASQFSTVSSESRFARATLDASFKNMLSHKETQISFLRAFTGRDDIVAAHDRSIEIPPLKPDYIEGKDKVSQHHLSFVCRLKDGDIFIAETQIKKEDTWDEGALYYATGVYSQQLKPGAPWTMLQNVVGINILDHDTGTLTIPGDYERHYQMVDTLHPELGMPYIQIRQFELPRVQLEEMEDGPKKQWLTLLINSMEMDDIPPGFDPAIQKAFELLDKSRWSGQLITDYQTEELDLTRYSKALQDEHTEGREEGRIEGRIEERKVIALAMIDEGESLDRVCLFTGLSKEMVENLMGR